MVNQGRLNKKSFSALSIIVILVGLVLITGFPGESEEPRNETGLDNSTDLNDGSPDSYAKPNESVAHEVEEDDEVDLEIVVDSNGINPARPELSVGDTVEFSNNLQNSILINIDRTDIELEVESGGSERLRFSGKTYYQVRMDGSIISRGSLNVE